MKTAVLLTFLYILTAPAFAAIPSTDYVDDVVTHVKEYTDNAVRDKQDTLTGSGAITVDQTAKTVSVASGTQTTAGVVKYGTIPTTSTGTGEAFIWVE